ncbi:hypothetical protein O181_001165 [Austropuccinia psidii MF-1]|uniref:Reverse transcriptase Ty1/copia-type domain-containing protein n=1 Tax=Austropuccinia psidii MF-1 TaxID=1389203 RepID=A0A9Q3BA54_9BASI|nr:hypothetical protein [Austropuccinia psidii MF-1]
MFGHNVWTPAPHSQHLQPLSTTWVFKRSTDENREFTIFKSRLCVFGFNQKEGIDYDEVFGATGRLTSLKFLLSLCSIHDLKSHPMEIKCAFPNGKPSE